MSSFARSFLSRLITFARKCITYTEEATCMMAAALLMLLYHSYIYRPIATVVSGWPRHELLPHHLHIIIKTLDVMSLWRCCSIRSLYPLYSLRFLFAGTKVKAEREQTGRERERDSGERLYTYYWWVCGTAGRNVYIRKACWIYSIIHVLSLYSWSTRNITMTSGAGILFVIYVYGRHRPWPCENIYYMYI